MPLNTNIQTFSIKENVWIGLTITKAAAYQILHLMANDKNMIGLRLGVKPSGCAGLCYVIDKSISSNKDDLIFKQNNAKLFVSVNTMPFIDGTEIDYVHEGLNCMFKFNNPKAQHACGCGESFSL